jgi:hypothetical protein
MAAHDKGCGMVIAELRLRIWPRVGSSDVGKRESSVREPEHGAGWLPDNVGGQGAPLVDHDDLGAECLQNVTDGREGFLLGQTPEQDQRDMPTGWVAALDRVLSHESSRA